ncbi:MAG: mechanosensitive ion channel family protein [Bacteroidia bacterium]|nr:mechanosensitive ion channel family protein [Bacteroidia bacterium]MDW8333389.1 mechanosensitive ion channel family protein [Bacteroidia bacterium]
MLENVQAALKWLNLHPGWFLAIRALLIVVVTFVVARIARRWVNLYHKPVGEKRLHLDPTLSSFLKNLTSAAIYFIGLTAAAYSIPPWREVFVSLFAGAGILAAIVGFAAQQPLANIINGLFIVIFRPVRVNDVVRIENLGTGVVEDITIRHTIIRNFENQRIVIPNTQLSNAAIVNFHLVDPRIRRFVEFVFVHGSPVERIIQIMREEAENHPLVIDARTSEEIARDVPKVEVRVVSVAPEGLRVRAIVWTKDFDDAWEVFCDLNRILVSRFAKEGFELVQADVFRRQTPV